MVLPLNFLSDAASAAARAGKTAVRSSADEVAGSAAVLAARKAAVKTALLNAAKASDNVAKASARSGTGAGLSAAKAIQKQADDAVKAGARQVDDAAEDVIQKQLKRAPPLKPASLDRLKAAKYTLGAATVATALGVSYDRLQKRNGQVRTVTAIESSSSTSSRVTFTPALTILAADALTFAGTDCLPSLDGSDVPVQKVLSSTQVLVNVGIRSKGSKGTLQLKTSFDNQLAGVLTDVASASAGAAGGAGGGIAGALLENLGLEGLVQQSRGYLIAGAAVLALLLVLRLVAFFRLFR